MMNLITSSKVRTIVYHANRFTHSVPSQLSYNYNESRHGGLGDCDAQQIMPPPVHIIEFESNDGEITAPGEMKTAPQHPGLDHRHPHQLVNATRHQESIFAPSEDHQHGESCRDTKRRHQCDINNIPECREKNRDEDNLPSRDESLHTKNVRRGLRVVFFIFSMLILGESNFVL